MDGWMDGWEWNRVECGSFGRGSEQHRGFDYRNTSYIGHGCETAEPQQDSRPRGGQLVCGPRAVSAPSNQLKAKRDRWMDGWMGVEWGGSFGRGP